VPFLTKILRPAGIFNSGIFHKLGPSPNACENDDERFCSFSNPNNNKRLLRRSEGKRKKMKMRRRRTNIHI
jgi:hypothetical protein